MSKSAFQQSDLKLVREGIPAYLMLMDGMIESVPDNEQLLINAAQIYSSFATAFMEETDPEYAKLLYGRARHYSLRSLEIRGLKDPAQSLFDDFREGVKACGKKDVPYLFWAATSWGNWIKLNLDSMEALAELPRVELMMKKVLELDEGFYYGGPHIFMGIWFASWPRDAGGDLEKAQKHFQRALEMGQGKFLMTYVYYANFYARQAIDKDLFVSTLQKVLDTPVDILPEVTLLNAVARKKAADLLNHKEEIFE
ncbi:MAG: TRAP transporter TatT component family protein [Proteobacteria bacterium]|nr:TRAP transporter TatT component family protein [Pseudomonadota bacterium]